MVPMILLCRLEAQQKQALLKQQLEYLSSAPFGDSPLFRMGLKVIRHVVRVYSAQLVNVANQEVI